MLLLPGLRGTGPQLRRPDLNPIEQLFAKLKTLLRAAAERSVEALWSTIGNVLDRFSPAECANYLANDGYCQSA